MVAPSRLSRSPACRAKCGNGGERCSRDTQVRDSGFLAWGTWCRIGLRLCMPMTICGVFAAPRAGAALHRRGRLVIGFWPAKAGWSAAGRSRAPPRGASTGSTGFHTTVFEPSYLEQAGWGGLEHDWLRAAALSAGQAEREFSRRTHRLIRPRSPRLDSSDLAEAPQAGVVQRLSRLNKAWENRARE